MRCSFLMLTVLGLIAALTPIATAAAGPSSKNNTGSSVQKGNATYPPAVDTKPADAARKKYEAARILSGKAQEKLNAVVDKLKAAFESSPDRKATVAAAQQARAQYDSLRTKVLDDLYASAKYKAALADRDQVVATLASSTGDFESAQKKMQANKTLTKLETDALAADSATVASQTKLTEVANKASAQLAEFNQSIRTNSEWQAAKEAADKAKSDTDLAEKDYNAELGREAVLQKERADAVADIDRQRLEQPGTSKGGKGKR